jgi:hypothetical protein
MARGNPTEIIEQYRKFMKVEKSAAVDEDV